MTLAVETRGLEYAPGRGFKISNLSMHVPAGSVYGFLGPNGAGKTTTFRLLLGLTPPAAGSITVLGRSMPRDHVAVMARTGYVPERPHLYPTLTVDQALRYHSSFHERWDEAWARDLQRQFSRQRPTCRLSIERRNGKADDVAGAGAAARSAGAGRADRWTLDPVVRREVLEALLTYVSSHSATVLISSHLVHELERICDWIAVMDRGNLVTELPMQEFKDGIKRLSVFNVPETLVATPFTVLNRKRNNGSGEQWLVRGWSSDMRGYFDGGGAALREVVDMDLEDGFVELLRSFRDGGGK